MHHNKAVATIHSATRRLPEIEASSHKLVNLAVSRLKLERHYEYLRALSKGRVHGIMPQIVDLTCLQTGNIDSLVGMVVSQWFKPVPALSTQVMKRDLWKWCGAASVGRAGTYEVSIQCREGLVADLDCLGTGCTRILIIWAPACSDINSK
jgi:hypothetical protein